MASEYAHFLLPTVKANLIIPVTFTDDDDLLLSLIDTAVDYAEKYQHKDTGTYTIDTPPDPTTTQGIILFSTFYYESRDGSTVGVFGDNPAAAAQVWNGIDRIMRLSKDWKV